MISETFVSTVLQSSITGAGLLFAIFGIIIPIMPKILESRLRTYKSRLRDFSEKIKDLEKKTPNHFPHDELIKGVEEIEEFRNPLPFTIGYVLFVFSLFTISGFLCLLWYFNIFLNLKPETFLNLIGLSFGAAIISFTFLAFDTIKNIFNIVENDYKEIKEDFKEYKKILELSKEEKDILKMFYKKSNGISGVLISLNSDDSKYRKKIAKLKMLNLISENHKINQKERFKITEYGINVILEYYPELKSD